MLFMDVYSWDLDKRDAVITRRLERGMMVPEGVKVLGERIGIGRNKGFMLFETDDPKLVSQFKLAWKDILHADMHIVLDTQKDLIGLLKG